MKPHSWPSGGRMIDRVRVGQVSFSSEAVDITAAMGMDGKKDGFVELAGTKCAYMVYLKRSNKLWKHFAHKVERLKERDALEVIPRDDTLTAFEIVGSWEACQEILACSAVLESHPLLSVRVPISATGMGTEKVRTMKKEIFGTRAQIAHTAAVIADSIASNIARQQITPA